MLADNQTIFKAPTDKNSKNDDSKEPKEHMLAEHEQEEAQAEIEETMDRPINNEDVAKETVDKGYQQGIIEQIKRPMMEHGRKPEIEAQKDIQKEKNKHEIMLDQLVKNNSLLLYKAKSVFPFDFFPDTITINLNQVNVVSRAFWGSARRHSVAIKDIEDVFLETSPFFCTLRIVDRGFVENTVGVKHLTRKDATKARRIIQGLLIAEKEGVDLTMVSDANLAQKIEELGMMKATD